MRGDQGTKGENHACVLFQSAINEETSAFSVEPYTARSQQEGFLQSNPLYTWATTDGSKENIIWSTIDL